MNINDMKAKDFDKLSDEEQVEVMRLLAQQLGGFEIDMKLHCPKEVKDWWEGTAIDMVKGGVQSLQLVMSNFFLALLKNTLSNNASGFDNNVTVALAILRGDIEVTYTNREISETPDMEVESDEDISKKTFH